MAHDEKLAARIRKILSRRRGVTEKRMVGGLSFLAGGAMCCGVAGAALMIRVGKDARDAALALPHTRPMILGGRELGGFICVEPAGIRSDKALADWVQRGLDFAAGLKKTARPPKTAGKRGAGEP